MIFHICFLNYIRYLVSVPGSSVCHSPIRNKIEGNFTHRTPFTLPLSRANTRSKKQTEKMVKTNRNRGFKGFPNNKSSH